MNIERADFLVFVADADGIEILAVAMKRQNQHRRYIGNIKDIRPHDLSGNDSKAGLFFYLAHYTIFRRFIKFQFAAREFPFVALVL